MRLINLFTFFGLKKVPQNLLELFIFSFLRIFPPSLFAFFGLPIFLPSLFAFFGLRIFPLISFAFFGLRILLVAYLALVFQPIFCAFVPVKFLSRLSLFAFTTRLNHFAASSFFPYLNYTSETSL